MSWQYTCSHFQKNSLTHKVLVWSICTQILLCCHAMLCLRETALHEIFVAHCLKFDLILNAYKKSYFISSYPSFISSFPCCLGYKDTSRELNVISCPWGNYMLVAQVIHKFISTNPYTLFCILIHRNPTWKARCRCIICECILACTSMAYT